MTIILISNETNETHAIEFSWDKEQCGNRSKHVDDIFVDANMKKKKNGDAEIKILLQL